MKIVGYIAAFLFGVIIEATDYKFLTKDIKWTDILSALATVGTAIIVYVTYAKWLESKKREDAYQTSKEYILCLVSISELVNDLMYPLEFAVPQAGNMVINREQSNSLLADSNEAFHKLTYKAQQLVRIKSELKFWGVKLAPEFEKNHDLLLSELSNAFAVTEALQSQINWYYNIDESYESNMFDEFSKLKVRVATVNELLNSRYKRKYSDFFLHEK
ncbi:TPA: hypothetical protein ACF311_004287 [Vibrio parahaemolyticus]|uniref:hypothetical protein n=1 Tax=Vibrio parahaemolyticus TaxID=670 RepID=UPI002AC3BF32|nr:hypothetical protein [Vibrio parahaemolyticus]MDZ5120747.1 hypothetical protein [Vibrio parahaemolyticus]HCH4062405.1 hypothetical protein [Vibrio parahaemolyticus]